MHVLGTNARTANLLSALALAITDLTTAAIEDVIGLGGSAPAALITIATRPGASIESLRRILGLSQPAAARLVDRLVAAGLVTREPGADARTLALRPTPSGRRRARAILSARHRAADTIVAALPERDRANLDRLLARMLASLPTSRDDARHLCRLCDQPACETPRCPVDAGDHRPSRALVARAREPRSNGVASLMRVCPVSCDAEMIYASGSQQVRAFRSELRGPRPPSTSSV